MRLKPWQRKLFKRDKLTNEIQYLMEQYIKEGYAKTEDEACSLLKNKWKTATREINSNGYWSYYFFAWQNPSYVVNSS